MTWITKYSPLKSGFYYVTRQLENGKRIAQNACFDNDKWNVNGVIAWMKYPKVYTGD